MKQFYKHFAVGVGLISLVATLGACAAEETHTHSYTAWGNNKTHHWKLCPEDREKDESTLEKHSDANADGKCDACGYEVGLPHQHSYTQWESDADNHWKICPEDKEKDTSSLAAHTDADTDGKCDACGRNLAKAEVTELTVDAISVDTAGKPTLVVKGRLPENVGCIKLHGDANNVHYYGDDISTEAYHFEVRFDLTQVSVEGTPWIWFHLYTYKEANPADPAVGFEKTDLMRGDALADDAVWVYDGVQYGVIGGEQTYGLVVIQPTVASELKVESVTIDQSGKPALVVKGTLPAGIGCIKLHADSKQNGETVHLYGDNVSTEAGKFELRFDLTRIPTNGEWAWFHIYTYKTAPADPGAGYEKLDLKIGDFLSDVDTFTAENVTYTVQKKGNWDMVVISATPAA